MYSDEQIEFLKQELKSTLYYFGYTNNSSYWFQHETSFFEYKDQTPEDLAKFKEFKTHNAELLAVLGQERTQMPNYRFNAHGHAPFDGSAIVDCSAQLTFDE